jgi:hypothetical protein
MGELAYYGGVHGMPASADKAAHMAGEMMQLAVQAEQQARSELFELGPIVTAALNMLFTGAEQSGVRTAVHHYEALRAAFLQAKQVSAERNEPVRLLACAELADAMFSLANVMQDLHYVAADITRNAATRMRTQLARSA